MNEKNKPIVIGILVLVIVGAGAFFIHSRMSASEEAKPVIVRPDNPMTPQRPADSPPVAASAN